jgi:DNA-binding MurR/RpiR family transcriptional regulator
MMKSEDSMDSLTFLIKSHISMLPESERKIADYILKKGRQVVYMNVVELADRSESSQSAVVRLCKSLGVPGFQELKIMLARDVFSDESGGTEIPKDQNAHFQPSEIIDNVIKSLVECIQDLHTSVDIATLESAASLIENAMYIQLFGLGTSSFVALDFYHKLNRLGYRCSYIQDLHLQLSASCALGPGTLGIFVSYSGETPEIIRAARQVLSGGGNIISLTKKGANSLSNIADLRLTVPVSESVMRQGASSSRIAQLAIVDMIFSLLVNRNQENSAVMLERTLQITKV